MSNYNRPDSYSESSPFVRLLKTESRVRMLDALLRNPNKPVTAAQISDMVDMSRTTIDRNIDVFLERGYFEEFGPMGNATCYQINTDSEVMKAFHEAQQAVLRDSSGLQNLPQDEPEDKPEDEMDDIPGAANLGESRREHRDLKQEIRADMTNELSR